MDRLFRASGLGALAIALASCTAMTKAPVTSADPAARSAMQAGFADPPKSARPRTWWHWMNGNITKDGIEKDLAWFDRIGLGGFQTFDASLGTPQIVDERLIYMTQGWKDAFRFATAEAERRGLEMAIAASPGWSETGGPWVKPEDGMKKLVWAETSVAGGKRFKAVVPSLPDVTGPYQDVRFFDPLAMGGPPQEPQRASGRVAVLAVPMAAVVLPMPAFSLSDGTPIATDAITDGSDDTSYALKVDDALSGEIRLHYAQPVTLRSAQLSMPGMKKPFRPVPILPVLQVKAADGWRDVASFELSEVPTTMGFAPVTGSDFRILVKANPVREGAPLDVPAPGGESFDIFSFGKIESVPIAELRLSGEESLSHVEEKAGFATALDYYAIASNSDVPSEIDAPQVIDLTDRVGADGSLDWTAPDGRDWRIMSFGWSLTGKTNHPAPPEATGLEADKLDPDAIARYLNAYLDMYADVVGPDMIGAHGIDAILTDSIEVGATNWTGAMEREFETRRGYALRPWLPALAGVVLGSQAKTEKFLYDYRQTLAEMLAEYHYGTVAKIAHERGLKVYGEALENGRPMLGDDLAMRRYADVPMAAMWTWWRDSDPRWPLLGDMKGASSVAHVYGRQQVAAESMTSANAPWAFAPRDLKRVIDLEFANGINLPVIHTSVHVPVDGKVPGLSLMIFGQHFNRNETWAEMAGPWIDYIARSSYMLQQGRNVADVAVFTGEEAPLTAQYLTGVPAGLPQARAFDYVDAAMLADALHVEGNMLVSAGGARYRALQLGGTSERMTLPTLRRVGEIARAGIPVIGARPVSSFSLSDDPAQFAALADAIWAMPTVMTGEVEPALDRLGIGPDFTFAGSVDADVRFVHRQAGDAEIYFVNNRRNQAEKGEARFRVTGMAPSKWNAITGQSEPLSYRVEGDETVVPLSFLPEDAYFVVFDTPVDALARTVADKGDGVEQAIAGPWTVSFQKDRGAPAQITMDRLHSLSEASDPGVRYFSGVASYETRFDWDGGENGGEVYVDLGKVADIAEVYVNGTKAGTAWFAPDRVAIGPLLRKGANTLTVKVADRWINRLIGDKQEGAEKVTFTAAPTYRADADLVASGLIGPVKLVTVQ